MELQERTGFFDYLLKKFDFISRDEGHCILISGEAGIGKTSLVNAFCREIRDKCKIFQGSCDALFSPRPLAPLYDIIWQLQSEIGESSGNISDRTILFTRLFHELGKQKDAIVVVIEDIHWADEATLDFIKFLARRITQLRCLFIVTYRDDQIHPSHPLRNVLGQLNPDSFTRMQLPPLSRSAVEKMAEEKGYKGEDVYSISGGIPFYVNEILASYSPGIPDNIKDAVLSVYNKLDEKVKQVWQVLSVLPTGIEIKYLEKMEPLYAIALENCLDAKIMISKDGMLHFKHELYRRTIENSLSPLVRIALNRKILDLFLENFELDGETERIIHHAKNANRYELIEKYAPLAAARASSVGAHVEASKLYLTAIEYYQGNNRDKLIEIYEAYAYECYLTNQIKEAIIYTGKSLHIHQEKNELEKIAGCHRFLSRLWWFEGNRKMAEMYATRAIDVLEDQPASKVKAMAYSNMSQLKMLSDQAADCIVWGEKAIAMATELGDHETLSHALNNVGVVNMRVLPNWQKGIGLMQKSLGIALKNSYHDHAARAYTNMASNAVEIRNYAFAQKILNEGLQYCEERDLDSYSIYLQSYKARLHLAQGDCAVARHIAENLVANETQSPVFKISALVVMGLIKMRCGEEGFIPLLLEAREKAFETMEPQRIIPVVVALLEYEWLSGSPILGDEELENAVCMNEHTGNVYERSEFIFWLGRARKRKITMPDFYEGYLLDTPEHARKAAGLWEKMNCPYEQALSLAAGNEQDMKLAIGIVQRMGATAIYEKLKQEMRASGIRSIPRGIRRSTLSNPANLTGRELDVLHLMKEGIQNKEIASRLFISPKTVDHHISSILFKLDVHSRTRAVQAATHRGILK